MYRHGLIIDLPFLRRHNLHLITLKLLFGYLFCIYNDYDLTRTTSHITNTSLKIDVLLVILFDLQKPRSFLLRFRKNKELSKDKENAENQKNRQSKALDEKEKEIEIMRNDIAR